MRVVLNELQSAAHASAAPAHPPTLLIGVL